MPNQIKNAVGIAVEIATIFGNEFVLVQGFDENGKPGMLTPETRAKMKAHGFSGASGGWSPYLSCWTAKSTPETVQVATLVRNELAAATEAAKKAELDAAKAARAITAPAEVAPAAPAKKRFAGPKKPKAQESATVAPATPVAPSADELTILRTLLAKYASAL